MRAVGVKVGAISRFASIAGVREVHSSGVRRVFSEISPIPSVWVPAEKISFGS